MSHPDDTSPAGGDWAPYRPTAESPWDLRRVVHLHRRAGFAATGEELRRDLEDGPEASVDRLLAGRMLPAAAAAEFERVSATIAEAAVDSRNPDRLKAWWIFRMLLGPDPLAERLTLMWHNHFATGNQKVDDLAAMRRQNDLFRRHARAPFGELLNAAVRDPALLIWLDAPGNRKGHPNENLARELMELFTLGIGHYSESDVKEAARALTGWTVADGAFLEYAANHDPGEKTILGRSGKWGGSGLIRLLLEHPATARRLAGRLCETFMGEGSVRSQDLDELAEGLRAITSISAGASRRSCDREPSSRRRTLARGSWDRSSSSSARCGRWVASTRRRTPWCWPAGRPGWARTCSTPRTSAAGPGDAPGSARAG